MIYLSKAVTTQEVEKKVPGIVIDEFQELLFMSCLRDHQFSFLLYDIFMMHTVSTEKPMIS